MADSEQLAIEVLARIGDLEKNMKKANALTAKAYSDMSKSSKSATRQMEADMIRSTRAINQAIATTDGKIGSFGKAFNSSFLLMSAGAARFAAVMGAGFSVEGFLKLVDAATKVKNSLKVAGLEGEQLDEVYGALFESAQQNAAPFGALVDLFSKARMTQRELGVSTSELLGFTDSVALALRVAGTDAGAASGSLLQLAQALGGGVVRAEEFNSIMEGVPTIVQAAAVGINEAGGSVAKLRQLVTEGKVSSQAFFRGFEVGARTLREKVAGSAETTDQAFVKLGNTLLVAAGRFDTATGASNATVTAIGTLATRLDAISQAFERAANGPIGTFIGKLKEINDLLLKYGPGFSGVSTIGDIIDGKFKPDVSADYLQRRLDTLKANVATMDEGDKAIYQRQIEDLTTRLAAKQITPALVPGKTTPVTNTNSGISLGSYPPPKKTTTTAPGSSSPKIDEFERALAAADKETAALNAQRAALAGLNPLAADYSQKVAAIAKAQDLLSSAQESGKAVAKELSDVERLLYGDLTGLTAEAQKQALAIRSMALEHASAADKVKVLTDAQNAAADSARQWADVEKDILNGGLSDLRTALEDGKVTWSEWGDIAASAISKVADAFQTQLVNQIVGNSGTSLLGSLFSGVVSGVSGGAGGVPAFADGTNYAPGGLSLVGERGPELVNLKRGAQVIPNHKLGAMSGNDGGVVELRVMIDKDGGLNAFAENVKGQAVRVAVHHSKQGLEQYRRSGLKADIAEARLQPRVR